MEDEKASGGVAGSITSAVADVIAALHGIPPMPTEDKKRIWRSITFLVTGSLEVPKAWLEGKAGEIRDRAQARSMVTRATARTAAARIKSDDEFAVRAIARLDATLFREQANRESVAVAAINDLRSGPPLEALSSVDPDWLHMFSRYAETKSNDELQSLFGRLLAGEIRKPGSFSPAAIDVLSKLTQADARSFQALLAVSTEWPQGPGASHVITEPLGYPGGNHLSTIGLPYSTLLKLVAAGVVYPVFDSGIEFEAGQMYLPIPIGNLAVQLCGLTIDPKQKEHWRTLGLTPAGSELRKIVPFEANEEYLRVFADYVGKRYTATVEIRGV